MTKLKKRAEKIVAERFGAHSPFPSAATQDRYARWFNKSTPRPDLMKVPKPYQSWQHIAEFLTTLDQLHYGKLK